MSLSSAGVSVMDLFGGIGCGIQEPVEEEAESTCPFSIDVILIN